jgi:D-inositol-3-phosphate glycosyltransferase
MPLLEPPPPRDPVADGRLDHPAGGGVLSRGIVGFRGWTTFPSGAASRVDVWLGEEPLGPARLGLPRPDVSDALELEPHAATGFELIANLESWPGENGAAILRATATGPEGERLELPSLSLRIAPAVERGGAGGARNAFAPRGRSRGLRTLIATHQLDLGGAQLYLMDLVRQLLRDGGIAPTVVSAVDGCLREELEALGVPVHICGPMAADRLGSHVDRVEELIAWTAERDFEVAFVNTGTTNILPWVEVARHLGIPAVWAIHESFDPGELWGHIDPAVRARAETALSEAAQPLFVAEATHRLFEPLIGDRGLTLPYGLDLEPIDICRSDFDRDESRRRAGIPLDAEVILCVGTIEPRKAQVPLVQAFDRVAAHHPRAHLVFVGAREDAYSEHLVEYAGSRAAAERIAVLPMTPDVQPWFGIADLLVCASDVESLPRTVLEAMAWEMPVVATRIFGLPELIEEGETGWLCEPRDLAALEGALARALACSPEDRLRIGRASRALVERRHSLEAYGREIFELLAQVSGRSAAVRAVDAAAR